MSITSNATQPTRTAPAGSEAALASELAEPELAEPVLAATTAPELAEMVAATMLSPDLAEQVPAAELAGQEPAATTAPASTSRITVAPSPAALAAAAPSSAAPIDSSAAPIDSPFAPIDSPIAPIDSSIGRTRHIRRTRDVRPTGHVRRIPRARRTPLVRRTPLARRTLGPTASFVGTALAFLGITFAAGAPSPLFVLYQQQWGFPDWLLTIAFAIYAITLLITLLVAGSLSDHVGRRPVLIGALAIEVASMLVFLVAPNVGWVIVARAVQGIATGAATGTFTAAIVELAPEHHKKLGGLIASSAPVGGLALGAFITGAAVQFAAQPTALIFTALTIVFTLGAFVVVFSPETVTRRVGAIRSLWPRVTVPSLARREFRALIPTLVATWMLGGLFLGLAPSIVSGVFHIESGFLNGAIVGLLPATSTVAAFALARFTARRNLIVAAPAVAFGVAIIVAGVVSGLLVLLFVGAIVSGVGFGAGFSGALRLLAPLADSHQRAELFAGVFLVCYLAYGVPALIAGQLIGHIGLLSTIVSYGAAIVVAALLGLAMQLRRR